MEINLLVQDVVGMKFSLIKGSSYHLKTINVKYRNVVVPAKGARIVQTNVLNVLLEDFPLKKSPIV